jgi:hypothetical protein
LVVKQKNLIFSLPLSVGADRVKRSAGAFKLERRLFLDAALQLRRFNRKKKKGES